MTFGLYTYLGCSQPSSIWSLVNSIFHDKLDEFVVIYIDDIFMYSKDVEEHMGHLEYFISKLKENQLFANI
jgi:hypothetical protein